MGIDTTYGQVIHLPEGRGPSSPEAAVPVPRPGRASLQEALPERASDAAALAFVLAALPPGPGPVLWVQDRVSRQEAGRLYLPGRGKSGLPGGVIAVRVNHPRDALWALEEGATCAGLSAVVGEIDGAAGVLDFTATKRLALRAEASGVPVWLIRRGGGRGLSAARERWEIAALPSLPHPHDPAAPGAPRWRADLFRARGRPPGLWVAQDDPHGGLRLSAMAAPEPDIRPGARRPAPSASAPRIALPA